MAMHDDDPGDRILDITAVFAVVLIAVLLMTYVTGVHFPYQSATSQNHTSRVVAPAAPK
jgi:hypothetical protein